MKNLTSQLYFVASVVFLIAQISLNFAYASPDNKVLIDSDIIIQAQNCDMGFALDFANNDYVSISDDATIKPDYLSVDIWFKIDNSSANRVIIAKRKNAAPSDAGFILWVDTSGNLNFRVYNTTGSNVQISTSVTNRTWHHVVATYDGVSAQLFLDGTTPVVGSSLSGAIGWTTDPLTIGVQYYSGSLDGYFQGTIDEIRIYNRTITQAEVIYSHKQGYGWYNPQNQTGLVLWQKLNEGHGSETGDSSGHNNNGTAYTARWVIGKIITNQYMHHQYELQRQLNLQNLTIGNNIVGMNHPNSLMSIECLTNSSIYTTIDRWFDNYITKIIVYAPISTVSDYQLITGVYGEPVSVHGVDTWSYDADDAMITFNCTSDATVTFRFGGLGGVAWYLEPARIKMWMGLGGLFCWILGPVMLVINLKQGKFDAGFFWALGCIIFAIGLTVGWLWE